MNKEQLKLLALAAVVSHAEGLAEKLTAMATEIEAANPATAEQMAAIRAVQAQLKDAQEVIAEKEIAAKEQADLVTEARRASAAVAEFSKPIRQTSPEPVARVTGGDKPGAGKGTFGFQSLAEYLKAAINSKSSGNLDRRIAAAATTFGRESVLPDGGFAVPPDYAANIEKIVGESETSLANLVDVRPTSSNRFEQVIDEEMPWTGGITVSWDGEGSILNAQKPKLGKFEIPVHKVRGMVQITDELLEDAPALQSMLTTSFGAALLDALNAKIVNGDGIGAPLGIMNSGSLVTVAKEQGQTADTVGTANLLKMWGRLHVSARASAVWLINQDVEAQLPLLTIGNQPVYLPPGGLTGAQYGTLFGRPVIPTEQCAGLGDLGDIVLFGAKSYLLMQRRGATFSSSMHFAFDQDIQSIKLVARYGGRSKWNKALARKGANANTLSNIVTLAERA